MSDGPPAGDAGTDAPIGQGAPSCMGLPETCGAGGDDSCCSSPEVSGGDYHRSFDLAGDVVSGSMSSPATVGPFRLDAYEVTVGRFRAFVEAGMGTQVSPPGAGDGAHPNHPDSGWDAGFNPELEPSTGALIEAVKCDPTLQTWTDAPAGNETRPINCVTWYEAMAFCAWDGAYLATEAEWNFAAAGGDEQRAYPWSSPAASLEIDGTRASYQDGADCVGDGQPGCALTDLIGVGTKPAGAGRFAQHDLAGNVQEWGLDYANTYPLPCDNCASLDVSSTRVVRGGGVTRDEEFARTAFRNGFPPENRFPDVGIRCAR